MRSSTTKKHQHWKKAIAVSALVDNIYDTAHIVLGGVSINLFMTHALSELASTETRIQFINFVPTSVESLKAFREVNEAVDYADALVNETVTTVMKAAAANNPI